MTKEKVTYKAAMTEIENILEKIENGELDVDELSENVKKVTELLKICKAKLHQTESEVSKILDESATA